MLVSESVDAVRPALCKLLRFILSAVSNLLTVGARLLNSGPGTSCLDRSASADLSWIAESLARSHLPELEGDARSAVSRPGAADRCWPRFLAVPLVFGSCSPLAQKQLVLRRLILQGPVLACLSFAGAAAHFNEVVSSRLPNTRFLLLQF